MNACNPLILLVMMLLIGGKHGNLMVCWWYVLLMVQLSLKYLIVCLQEVLVEGTSKGLGMTKRD